MRLLFNYSQMVFKTVFKTFARFPKLLIPLSNFIKTRYIKFLTFLFIFISGTYIIIRCLNMQIQLTFRFWSIIMPFIKQVPTLTKKSAFAYAYNVFYSIIAPNLGDTLKFNHFCERVWVCVIIFSIILVIFQCFVGQIKNNTGQIISALLIFGLIAIFYNIFSIDLYLNHSLEYQLELKKTNPDFYNFQHSDGYKIFRYFVGRGDIYNWDTRTSNLVVDKVNLDYVDPLHVLNLKSIPSNLRSIHCKMLGVSIIQPPLNIVQQLMDNPGLYRIHYHNFPHVDVIDLLSIENMFKLYYTIYDVITYNHLGSSIIAIIFVIFCILTMLYLINFITSISSKDNEKLSPYECGFDPIHTNARIKFDVLYWIIGILYQIFDLELIFIFPLATILHDLQNPIGLLVYLIFIIILTLGFIYEWKKGALKLNL